MYTSRLHVMLPAPQASPACQRLPSSPLLSSPLLSSPLLSSPLLLHHFAGGVRCCQRRPLPPHVHHPLALLSSPLSSLASPLYRRRLVSPAQAPPPPWSCPSSLPTSCAPWAAVTTTSPSQLPPWSPCSGCGAAPCAPPARGPSQCWQASHTSTWWPHGEVTCLSSTW